MNTSFSVDASQQFKQLAWRILLLLNFFRVLVPLVLGTLSVAFTPSLAGQQHPALFAATLTAYELFALTAFTSLKPALAWVGNSSTRACIGRCDCNQRHHLRSGGMSSGLAPYSAADRIR